MPGPIGNKHALGNCGGRKETPYEDKVKIYNDFIEFARSNTNCLTVPMFTAPRGMSSDTLFRWAQEDDELKRLFYTGKDLISVNRLNATKKDTNGNASLSDSTYQKTLHHYDYEYRMTNREEKAFEAGLREKIESQKTYQIVVENDGLGSGLKNSSKISSETLPNTDNNNSK